MNPTFHMSCFCCQISKTFLPNPEFQFQFQRLSDFLFCLEFSSVFSCRTHTAVGVFFCFFFFFNLSGGQLLYNIGWFLPYINMNWPWVYMCHAILNPLPPPSPPYPSGLCQSLGFGCSASCIELALVV